jgi:hypothetical protein
VRKSVDKTIIGDAYDEAWIRIRHLVLNTGQVKHGITANVWDRLRPVLAGVKAELYGPAGSRS